jgi:hypothetical protein
MTHPNTRAAILAAVSAALPVLRGNATAAGALDTYARQRAAATALAAHRLAKLEADIADRAARIAELERRESARD